MKKFYGGGNLSLGNHSADLLNFGRSQTPSLVSRPKFSKNYESHTAITSIVLNMKCADWAKSNKQTKIHAEVSLSDFVRFFYVKIYNNLHGSILRWICGLCSCERGNRTNSSLTKRTTNLPQIRARDNRA